jgi:hypothetical protein
MPRFFGFWPTDWYESMDGHQFSLAFEQEPDEATRTRMAVLVDRSREKGEADVAGPFRWSGRLLTFRASGWGVTHLPRVRRWVMQVHAEIPVTDVVFHDIREGDEDRGEPVAAPPGDLTGRPVDPALPPLAPDQAFDSELARLSALRSAAYEKARNQADSAKLDKALAKQKQGAAVRFERLDGEVSPVTWDERLCERFEVPDPPMVRPPNVPETSRHRVRAPGDHPIPHPRRALARVVGDRPRLAYLDSGGERHEVIVPGTSFVSVRADGARGVVGCSVAIIVIDFENHTSRWLPRPDPHASLHGVAYLADDGVAVLTGVGLYLIDPDDRIVAKQARTKPGRLFQVADGHGVGVCDASVSIFAVAGGKLKKAASLATGFVEELAARGDVLELTTRGGNLRVIGLETLRSPAKKRATRPVDVPVARFQALDQAPPRPEPPPAGPARTDWSFQFTRADGVDVGQGFGQVMWQAPGGAEGAWTGPRMSVGLQPFERALYLYGPDLLLVFDPLQQGNARVFTCTDTPPAGEIRELAPITFAIDDAYDHDGAVIVTGPWGAVRIDGLGEAIRQAQT